MDLSYSGNYSSLLRRQTKVRILPGPPVSKSNMYMYKLGDEYLQYSETDGHTGKRVFVNWTKDISQASKFAWITASLRNRMRDLGAEALEAPAEIQT